MIGIKEPPTIVIRPDKPSEAIEGMSFTCPHCSEEIVRYDLRLHHYIWECIGYPQEKKRRFFMNQNDQDPVHS